MPVPSWERAWVRGARWKRWKRRGSWSGAMPTPVSATTSSTRSPAARSVRVTPPRSVNFRALDSRLRTIFSHMSGSTWAGRSRGGHSTVNESPARSMAGAKDEAMSRVRRARSTRTVSARSRPPSMRAKSSMSSTRRRSRRALRRITSSRAAWIGGRVSRSSFRLSSAGPRIRVSGVRNSWLTLEKNSVFARSSSARDSARRRSASKARALASPAAT